MPLENAFNGCHGTTSDGTYLLGAEGYGALADAVRGQLTVEACTGDDHSNW
jgi:hypothetical protein